MVRLPVSVSERRLPPVTVRLFSRTVQSVGWSHRRPAFFVAPYAKSRHGVVPAARICLAAHWMHAVTRCPDRETPVRDASDKDSVHSNIGSREEPLPAMISNEKATSRPVMSCSWPRGFQCSQILTSLLGNTEQMLLAANKQFSVDWGRSCIDSLIHIVCRNNVQFRCVRNDHSCTCS